MCHQQLRMVFGPRVNYVSGQNGSGKSAILNALQAVFGCKAKSTGRDRAKDWIRKTKDGNAKSADVVIKLNNHYKNRPYQAEKYGDEIYVKRHITMSSSGWFFSLTQRQNIF